MHTQLLLIIGEVIQHNCLQWHALGLSELIIIESNNIFLWSVWILQKQLKQPANKKIDL